MADFSTQSPTDGRFANRGWYYNPPTHIKSVPGLVAKKDDTRSDFYSGSAEAMIAAGLLAAEMFPGQPGRNAVSQSYRPTGVERIKGESWCYVPGYMLVTRTGSGRFQIHLTVTREERARRRAEIERESKEAEQRRQTPTPATPVSRRDAVRVMIETLVEKVGFEEVQRVLDEAKPRRTAPRPKYLQLVAP